MPVCRLEVPLSLEAPMSRLHLLLYLALQRVPLHAARLSTAEHTCGSVATCCRMGMRHAVWAVAAAKAAVAVLQYCLSLQRDVADDFRCQLSVSLPSSWCA